MWSYKSNQMEEMRMNKFKSEIKIGNLVAEFPKSADILKEYKVDFCCGGDRPLIEAIKEQNIDEQEIMNKINGIYDEYIKKQDKDKDWQTSAYSELVEHIVNTHHAYIQSVSPKIAEFTAKILRVHGAHHPELAEVHRLFSNLKTELELHLIKEESIEFPAIIEFEKNPNKENLENAVKIITELEAEHDGAGDIVKELRKVTKDYKVPDDGCNSYRLTYKMLEEFESDLFQHIHLENNILFPRMQKEA